MVVMAGTASAQVLTELGACITIGSGRVGTLILVTTPSGEHIACIGKYPY
jgi:hypothetical protein